MGTETGGKVGLKPARCKVHLVKTVLPPTNLDVFILECKEHSIEWCDSKQDVMLTPEVDLDIFVSMLMETEDYYLVAVPYYPSLGYFAVVELRHLQDQIYSLRLFDQHIDDWVENLGMISPGDGLNVIRGIVHQYWTEEVEREEASRGSRIICQSGSHNFRMESQLKKDVADKGIGIEVLNKSSVMQSGRCMYCDFKYRNPNADDLVPVA